MSNELRLTLQWLVVVQLEIAIMVQEGAVWERLDCTVVTPTQIPTQPRVTRINALNPQHKHYFLHPFTFSILDALLFRCMYESVAIRWDLFWDVRPIGILSYLFWDS